MMETIVKLGAWGAFGLLAGIAFVTWLGDGLRPEGVALILAVSVAASVVAGGIVRFLLGGGGE